MTGIRPHLGRALLASALLWPAAAAAQQWDVGIAAARSVDAPLGAPLTTIAPNGGLAGRGWRITSEFGTIDRPTGAKVGMAFSAAALGPRIGPFRTEAYGDYASRAGGPQGDVRAAARLHWATATRGVWAGFGAARAGDRTGMLGSIGAWLQGRMGSASFRLDQVTAAGQGAGVTSFDTIGGAISYVYRPGSPPVRIHSLSARYTTPGGRLELALGAAQMEGSAALTRRSGSAVATWWVGHAFALVAGYGPPVGNGLVPIPGATKFGVIWRPFKGMPRTLSLVEPAATAVTSVARTGPGKWRVRLPAEGARSVEIQGSFGGWEPVPLRDAGDGWWEATLPLAPGRYELTWRRDDGSWRTLPGLPTVSDDLLGKVSVLVIDQE